MGDAALVASLVVMVIISGYENFVSRFDNEAAVHWLGQIDAGSLKVKVASTIVAISSIHLLQVFLNVHAHPAEQLMWYTLIHLAFVASALFLALIDRVSALTKAIGKTGKRRERGRECRGFLGGVTGAKTPQGEIAPPEYCRNSTSCRSSFAACVNEVCAFLERICGGGVLGSR